MLRVGRVVSYETWFRGQEYFSLGGRCFAYLLSVDRVEKGEEAVFALLCCIALRLGHGMRCFGLTHLLDLIP